MNVLIGSLLAAPCCMFCLFAMRLADVLHINVSLRMFENPSLRVNHKEIE